MLQVNSGCEGGPKQTTLKQLQTQLQITRPEFLNCQIRNSCVRLSRMKRLLAWTTWSSSVFSQAASQLESQSRESLFLDLKTALLNRLIMVRGEWQGRP